MKYKFIVIFLLLIVYATHGQSKLEKLILKIPYQDSTKFYNNKFWFTYSGGPSIGINKSCPILLVWGPGIDLNWINKNYNYLKIKASAHIEVTVHTVKNYSFEFNFMTGKIKKANQTDVHTLTYGIGINCGLNRQVVLKDGSIKGSETSFWSGAEEGTTIKSPFLFIGIPLEYKFQSNWFGLGVDANLNPYLPYFGTKLFIQFRSKYYR